MRIKLDINAPVLSSQVLVHVIKLDRAQRRTTTPKIIHARRESRSERFCTVPVRSFVRRFSQVSFLFSFDARLTIVFCCAVVLFFARPSRKKLKCLVPQFYAQFYTNHTQSTHGTFSFSLSLCLVDGRRRFLFGFSRGRNSSEFNAREDEEEKRSRDLRFRVARVRDIFLSFFFSPQI
mgnify:CR=1 FL=1